MLQISDLGIKNYSINFSDEEEDLGLDDKDLEEELGFEDENDADEEGFGEETG